MLQLGREKKSANNSRNVSNLTHAPQNMYYWEEKQTLL